MTNFDDITEPIEQRLTAGLLRIGTALRAQSWATATSLGLTPTQMEILVLALGRSQPLKLKDLAEQTALTSATVSDAVKALDAKGLLVKGKVEGDGRAIAISLTPAGKEMAQRAGDWSHFLIDAAQTLGAGEQIALHRVLIQLIRTLQEREQIPTARMCVSCEYFRANQHADPHKPHHCELVGAPFGDGQLRLDCPEHLAAEPVLARKNWASFVHIIEPAR
ncbi:MarR family winged helix-turn-helix transcriptional regulator [Chitinimonas naiadis]